MLIWIVPLVAAAAQPVDLLPEPVELAQQIEAPAAETLSLAPLLETVRARNPDLHALDEERAAALDRAVAAGSMPHPSLGFAVRMLPLDTLSFNDDMMTMKEVMVRQEFPWFGKRDLAREAAGKNADIAEAQRASQMLALEEITVSAYANLWLASASVEVVEGQREALGRFAHIARGRYAAGGGSQSDLLRADVEFARIDEPLLALDEARIESRATLAALADVDLAAVEGDPEAPPLPPLPENVEPFLAAVPSHPDLRAIAVQAEQHEVEARVAEKDRWPNPEVGIAYGQRNDLPDMIGAEVMFQIPVFASSKEDKLASASRSQARAARSRADALQRRLESEVRAAWAAASRHHERIRLYDEEIVPRAERNLISATGAYQSGSVDFLTLLDARVQLQNQQLEALRARASYVRELARLARASGVSLLSILQPADEVHRG